MYFLNCLMISIGSGLCNYGQYVFCILYKILGFLSISDPNTGNGEWLGLDWWGISGFLAEDPSYSGGSITCQVLATIRCIISLSITT